MKLCVSMLVCRGQNRVGSPLQEVRNLLKWELGIEFWHSGSQQIELLSQVLSNLQKRILCFY